MDNLINKLGCIKKYPLDYNFNIHAALFIKNINQNQQLYENVFFCFYNQKHSVFNKNFAIICGKMFVIACYFIQVN